MIEFLQGELAAKSPGGVTVRVAGVGFRLRTPLSTFERLPREGQQTTLLVHLYVREDELSLYGFATELERELFRILLGVSHIGPAVALRILSSVSVADFKRYILDEDVDSLKAMVKGIGPKTARRLIAELHGPVQELAVEPSESMAAGGARDAVEALVALGESRSAAQKAVQAALKELGSEASSDELVEAALSR
jgi:Holliday junction DNA helicase RuvA